MAHRQQLVKSLLLGLCLLGSAGCLSPRAVGLDYSEKSDRAATSLSMAVQVDAYIIGPGDLLSLKLFDAPEMSGELNVLSDGSV